MFIIGLDILNYNKYIVRWKIKNMKKVGILSFYFADNYGAVLQCFALRKVINKKENYLAEIIPYIPKTYCAAHYWTDDVTYHKYIQKRRLFKNFLEKNLGLDKEVCSIVNGRGFDIVCVGSDQVWNKACMNTNEYFLPNLEKNIKKISYAASLGLPRDSKELDKRAIKKYVSLFQDVSVREYEHIELIENLTKKKCFCVLDPTLLLAAEDYEEIISKENLRDVPFLFFFWLIQNDGKEREAIEFANKVARKYKLKIVHNYINAPEYMFTNDMGCMYFEGVENFLWYMKNADFVITNSYHGTIFAIQFQRPFYTFVFQNVRSRIDTLIKKLGIQNRVIETDLEFSKIDKKMNYFDINQKLKKHRKWSFDYLDTALGVEKDGNL